MAGKTQAVRDLVQKALASLPTPYGPDIIDRVLGAIEQEWRSDYDAISKELDPGSIHQWIGKYTKELTGKQNGQAGIPTRHTRLAKTYTRLI